MLKLNVGGHYFQTTSATLLKSGYFRNRVSEITYSATEYGIDRSGILFEHVINFMRDSNYPYPTIYYSELEYYDVDDRIKLKSMVNGNTNNPLEELYKKIEYIYQKVDYCYTSLKLERGTCINDICENDRWYFCDEFNYCSKCAILKPKFPKPNGIKEKDILKFDKALVLDNGKIEWVDGRSFFRVSNITDLGMYTHNVNYDGKITKSTPMFFPVEYYPTLTVMMQLLRVPTGPAEGRN